MVDGSLVELFCANTTLAHQMRAKRAPSATTPHRKEWSVTDIPRRVGGINLQFARTRDIEGGTGPRLLLRALETVPVFSTRIT
jgi:hypothetical protein